MRRRILLKFFWLSCLFFLISPDTSTGKNINPGRLLQNLRSSLSQEKVLQCRFNQDHRFLSVLTVEEKTIDYSDKFRLIHHSIFNTRKGYMISKTAVSEEKVKSLIFRQDLPSPPPVRFSPHLLGFALCRQKEENTQPEIEFWSLKHKKMLNYLKTPLRSCEVDFYFSEKEQKVAVIHRPTGKMLIWNLSSGVREEIPEVLEEAFCLGVSRNLQKAYCMDSDHRPSAFNTESGSGIWHLQFPENTEVSFLQKWGKKLFKFLDLPLPSALKNILSEKPGFVGYSQNEDEIFTYYSPGSDFAGYRRNEEFEEGVFFRHSLTDGSYLSHHQIKEPGQTHLIKILYDELNGRLIGEDYNPARKQYLSLLTMSPKTGQIRREGSDCSSSWDYWPETSSFLSCGHCEEENIFRLQLLPVNPDQKEKQE